MPFQMPGKLNLSDFHKVSSALSSMQDGKPAMPKPRSPAPLAHGEDLDGGGGGGGGSGGGYAVPRDSVSSGGGGGEYAQPIQPSQQQEKHRPRHRERREQLAMQQGVHVQRIVIFL